MSFTNIVACRKKNKLLIALSKITLAPLALFNVLINTNFDCKITNLLKMAYLLYLIGDILLLSNNNNWFVTGLISFLFGHIVFIIIFSYFTKSYLIILIAALILIYPEIKILNITKGSKSLKIPMRIYSFILLIFIAMSSTTLNIVLIAATSLFTLSDSFIAKNNSYKIRRYSDTAVMLTYSLALILLSIGMILLNR